ncbi:hypothetical protein FXO38_27731 [Capsicum annuum]|nr:hypothetical protein FXO38_27731 [Capsicum annuum]KAF3641410.1 hypothetical protein FXO37_23009 [Capsicum annuum]
MENNGMFAKSWFMRLLSSSGRVRFLALEKRVLSIIYCHSWFLIPITAWSRASLVIWASASSIQEVGVLFGAGGVEMKIESVVLFSKFGSIGRGLEKASIRFGKDLYLCLGLGHSIANPLWASLRGRPPFWERDDPSLAILRKLYSFTGG